ncbi:flavodoxin family protein [Dickeya dianthicola]|uniref:flavodoxin family protein n=1 Tax=Dickeya dianthicola TaxID=204039 RepID=UPI00039C18B7|nr:flavodoxin family protein [Dickeya dianthicola]MCI4030080.1 flavodoxin family protein [Dickeya dianthicola]MCI4171762.1 flavodoxin family protein [Dickeya dianthicola]MCI4176654.1 flavodoxin family protein [Dickeya dianthicola]MCI4182518.1 flavodoxin family protein [Dickeya dianthicola]MCI4195157.1 flavodoxin family protein [Dickeya dianthicola]
MSKAVVVYFSGYGHTKRVAEAAAEGAQAALIEIDGEGNIPEAAWGQLDEAQSIIFGAPTYMGSVPWQFKKFADATSKKWFVRQWQDKAFGGFTNSASLNGDKQVSLIFLQTLASQHGGIWVSLGLPPANSSASTRADVNNLGGSVGALVQSPSDVDAQGIPDGDLETVKLYAARIAKIGQRLHA